jgi:hypothetical protein
MKTMTRIIATLILIAVLVNVAGCYGSFSLTKKVYNWNGSLGDKWINSVVMWVFLWLPVYEAAGFIDLVLLNTIEFWTGNNPVTMQEGQQNIKYASNEGKTYKIETTKNQIVITETVGPDKGKAITLNYVPETGNWTLNDGKTQSLVANVNGSNMKLFTPEGEARTIKLAQ